MSKKKTVAVVLSGCGVYDGAEIHEAVLTLLALDRAGVDALITAPDKDQMHVVNHLTGDVMEETRNVLVESARIARGKITALADVTAAQFDALIFPGGFGAAKNLSDYAVKGAAMTVDPDVTRLVAETRDQKKPIGFICISPTIAARLIPGVRVTLGCDADARSNVQKMGGQHVDTAVEQTVIDDDNNVVSTAAYMLGPWVANVAAGIDKLVDEVLARA